MQDRSWGSSCRSRAVYTGGRAVGRAETAQLLWAHGVMLTLRAANFGRERAQYLDAQQTRRGHVLLQSDCERGISSEATHSDMWMMREHYCGNTTELQAVDGVTDRLWPRGRAAKSDCC